MYCSQCGALLDGGERFCPKCGTPTLLNQSGEQSAPIQSAAANTVPLTGLALNVVTSVLAFILLALALFPLFSVDLDLAFMQKSFNVTSFSFIGGGVILTEAAAAASYLSSELSEVLTYGAGILYFIGAAMILELIFNAVSLAAHVICCCSNTRRYIDINFWSIDSTLWLIFILTIAVSKELDDELYGVISLSASPALIAALVVTVLMLGVSAAGYFFNKKYGFEKVSAVKAVREKKRGVQPKANTAPTIAQSAPLFTDEERRAERTDGLCALIRANESSQWDCPKCGTRNSASLTECKRCGCKHDGGDAQ